MNRTLRRLSGCGRCAATLATVLWLGAGVAAQTQPPDQDATSDPLKVNVDVVVTGTRTDVDIQKAPVSTTVVTRQELEIRNTQTLDQSLSLIGGLYDIRTKGPADTNTRINMRGFNGANRTLVLIDGQPLNDAYTGEVSWSSLPTGEVDRVEVVRGPFSSLYGGNAMSGVVNILTRPINGRSLAASAMYGTYGTGNYSARYADRVKGRLGFSLGYQRLRTEGYEPRAVTAAASTATTGTRVTGVEPTFTTAGARTYQIGWSGKNSYDQNALRAKSEYTAGASTLMSVQYVRQASRYAYEGFRSTVRDTLGNTVERGPVLFDDGGVTRAVTFTPGTFISGPGQARSNLVNASFQHQTTRLGAVRVMGGYYDQPDNSFRTPATATANLTGGPGSISLRASRSYYGNAQYALPVRGRHTVIAGTELRQERSDNQEFSQSNWTDVDSRLAQTYASGGRTSTIAAYVQDQVLVNDKLTLVAGGRLDHWRTFDGMSDTFSAVSPRTVYPSRSQNALTGKVSAAYQASDALTIRASAGTAFRNPTVYDLYRTFRLGATLYLATPTLQPERLLSGETGAVYRFGSRASVEATVFHNRTTDMIYRQTDLVLDPTGATRVNVNAGEGRTTGLELGGGGRLARWLELRATYSYTDAIISKNPALPASEGRRVPYIPAHMSSVSALLARGQWTGSFSVRHAGNVFTTDTNTDTTKGVPGSYNPFTVADGSVSFRLHRSVDLLMQADNLFNTRFYSFYLNPGRTVNAGFRIIL